MEIILLIKSVVGLIAILALLIFILFLPSVRKKREKKIALAKKTLLNTDMKFLRAIINRKNTTTKELQKSLDLVLKHHGVIDKKLDSGVRHAFDVYMEIIVRICTHPNTTKEIIISFTKELERLNPNYKSEINDAITKGLNSRRV
jgi:hypothetical protein